MAARQEKRAAAFHQEYLEAQSRAEQIRTERDTASAAFERFASYHAQLDGDYCCPRCWIERNATAPLLPKPSSTREDVFECRDCGYRIAIAH
jgi:DNA-directed RNA polymerase subunit RPC12/RpoP